jgi:kynurenine formamidase
VSECGSLLQNRLIEARSMSGSLPGAEEVVGWLTSLSNWGRWGPEDKLGTLNHVTQAKVVQAAGLVREGVSVTCSRLIHADPAIDDVHPPLHFMLRTGESAPHNGKGGASDFIAMHVHGYNVTHVDAHAHQFWEGRSYNRIDARQVTASDGATEGGIQVLENGTMTRGVLLDIAGLKGVPWLRAGEPILPQDLEAAERAQGVRVEPGDALLYRTGWPRARRETGPPPLPNRPGLHAACLPWLHERSVALIAADAATDVEPTGYENVLPFGRGGGMGGLPVHTVGITAMGLWIVDSADFELLAQHCQRRQRWEFCFVLAPLRWRNATGSPVNPLAIF